MEWQLVPYMAGPVGGYTVHSSEDIAAAAMWAWPERWGARERDDIAAGWVRHLFPWFRHLGRESPVPHY